jgi:predicted phosphodiesterase
MLVAVFGDAHAHAEALDAVIAAAERHGADELWSLGDMIGAGPDPAHVVAATRAHCAVALMGNHDYGATGGVALERFGDPASANARSIVLARGQLDHDDLAWMRTRRPAARRHGVQCWHGGPRNPVWEYVTPSNAGACLEAQRADLGLVGHTHLAAAFQQAPRRARRAAIEPGVPLDIGAGRWLLNPGAVGAPVPPRRGWWDALDADAAAGAFWLLLDLGARTATWYREPYDPGPARRRARALGLDDTASSTPTRAY